MRDFLHTVLRKSGEYILVCSVAALTGTAAVAFAFTEPSVGPTGGTVYAPVNTSGVAQTKSGNLTSSGTLTGSTVNGTSQMCLAGSCISSWPVGGGITGSGSTNYVSKWTGATSLGNSVIYDNGTNVGVGTTNPTEKLEIGGNVYSSGLGKFGDRNAIANGIAFWGTPQGVLIGAPSGMMVGIGASGNGSVGVGISYGNTPYGAVGYDATSGSFTLSAYNRDIVIMPDANRNVIFPRGNVGIGTASPSQKLEISGLIKAGRLYIGDSAYGTYAPGIGTDGTNIGVNTNGVFAVLNGTASWYQPIYASDYYIANIGKWASSLSDARLKKDILPLGHALEKLEKINGVSFLWNDLYPKPEGAAIPSERNIGVVAQEVEGVFPELVHSGGEYKSVDYDGLTAVLLEGLKELKTEHDALKAKNEELKRRIELLEAR